MKLEQHVLKAIDDYEDGHAESALMHACAAIEGTARNLSGEDEAGKKDYKECLRNYYWIIEPMVGAGLNLEETKWTNIKLDDGYGKIIQNPDLADIIYHIFRCSEMHGKPVPVNYELIPSEDWYSVWSLEEDTVKMPEKIIWALLAVSVFSKANKDINTVGDYYLTWGSETLGLGPEKFIIRDWWGRENDFKVFLSKQNLIRVKLDNL